MNNKEKTISIALCTYNGGRFLKEQLNSIIHQTWQPDEIIICDDQSKDNSVLIAKSILQQWSGKWRIIINEHNLGFKKNFQKAMGLCKGDIIFLSDQDDVWNTRKIEKMMPAFNDQNVILAFHDAEVVDKNLKLLYPSLWEIMDFFPKTYQDEDFKIIFAHNVMQGAACCFRRELFQIAKPFPKDVFHDEWVLLMALCVGKVIPVKESLLKYRQAQNAVGGMPMNKLQKIKKWLESVHEATNGHIDYIEKRDFLYSELVKHFTDNQSKLSSFYEQASLFELFLKQRLLAIKHIQNYPNHSEYNRWYLRKTARHQRIKDYLLKMGF